MFPDKPIVEASLPGPQPTRQLCKTLIHNAHQNTLSASSSMKIKDPMKTFASSMSFVKAS